MALSPITMDEVWTVELRYGPIHIAMPTEPAMRLPRFKKWFASLPALNQPQRRQVLDALRPAASIQKDGGSRWRGVATQLFRPAVGARHRRCWRQTGPAAPATRFTYAMVLPLLRP